MDTSRTVHKPPVALWERMCARVVEAYSGIKITCWHFTYFAGLHIQPCHMRTYWKGIATTLEHLIHQNTHTRTNIYICTHYHTECGTTAARRCVASSTAQESLSQTRETAGLWAWLAGRQLLCRCVLSLSLSLSLSVHVWMFVCMCILRYELYVHACVLAHKSMLACVCV